MNTLFVTLLMLVSGLQIIQTSLKLTIRNELGNPVSGVVVQLYDNESDYINEKNSVTEGITNKKGIVKFHKLEGKTYFVLATKEKANNRQGGEALYLEKGKANNATIIIE